MIQTQRLDFAKVFYLCHAGEENKGIAVMRTAFL
jgi:hypothetical protein